MNKQEKDLISLGYRQMKPNIWGKPVGFHLFIYNIVEKEWSNHFYGRNGNLFLWGKKVFKNEEENNLIETLGVVEQYTKITLGNWEYPLNFTTKQEQIENIFN